MFQPLEHRRLLAATLTPDGVLVVEGTADNDAFVVSLDNRQYSVSNRGGTSLIFPRAQVKSIAINAGGGDDRVELLDPFLEANGKTHFPGTVPADLPVNARIVGGQGDDTLFSGGGSDTLIGGKGADLLQGRGGADEFWGGPSNDQVDYANFATRVNVDIDDQPDDGPPPQINPPTGANVVDWPFADNVHTDVENLRGGSGDDDLTGSDADNRLDGGAGNNFYRGLGGNDTLRGGTAADAFGGGDGFDTVDYSDRAESLVIGVGDNLSHSGGGTITQGDHRPMASENDGLLGDIERVWGGAGSDFISGNGNGPGGVTTQVFEGGLGDDTLVGSATDDTLGGGRGNDDIRGGDLTGTGAAGSGIGADLMSGGPGVDTIDYSGRPFALRVTLDGVGNDGTSPGVSAGGIANPDERDNVMPDFERLYGGQGNDFISATSGRNTLIGNAGADTLQGLGGDDILLGGAGNGASDPAGTGNVLQGGDGFDLTVNFTFDDDVSTIERGEAYGVVDRYIDSFGGGSTGWVVRRGDTFTDVDPTGRGGYLKTKRGQFERLRGDIEMRPFIERGNVPVLVVDWG